MVEFLLTDFAAKQYLSDKLFKILSFIRDKNQIKNRAKSQNFGPFGFDLATILNKIITSFM